jgi:hypothetical protein
MSPSNLFSLTYQVTYAFYEHSKFSTHNLSVMANILLYPLLNANTQAKQIDLITKVSKDFTKEKIVTEIIRNRNSKAWMVKA